MTRKSSSRGIFRDAIQLLTGTLGGRLILLVALPFLTRLYEPDDFKLLAVFIALISSISVVSCLRMDVAIPLAENDDDATNLLAISLIAAAISSILIFVLSMISPEALALSIGTPGIEPYFWLISLGIFLGAGYTALQYWATRMHRFGLIARTRISQSATGAGSMLGLGWFGIAPLGLLIGNLLTLSAGGFLLSIQTWKNDQRKFAKINRKRIRETLVKYRRFMIFSTPEAFTNVISVQIPILIFAAHSGAEAGQLYLSMQVVAIPMTLMGASFAQVYASRAAAEQTNATLHKFTAMMMRRLFFTGLLPMILVILFGPMVFTFIFGTEWQRAGQIAAWIAPWMLAQLISSPVSMVMSLIGYQKEMLYISVFGAVARIAVVVIASHLFSSIILEAYAVASAIFFIASSIVFYRASKLPPRLHGGSTSG
ncbi:lipopolysaccharide biosynthesis protein [Roseinatronobacter monicus]|uniref:O-antigen/teichoic acid export membrane protein n=1 Tax=Roseinatronobacter monicus TaxID=393481 RepID=A0A543K5J1_9RHOB|nr:oligosaccharide flippase family protein [Roseinatronobacter monicus]TQM90347.1 O-antigen/teichoic acid export membrane protein [Roseinatronobacter monicus]